MKTILFSAIFALATFSNTIAQSTDQTLQQTAPQRIYIGAGGGINNICGFMGGTLEIPLDQNTSLKGGAGIGIWGFKIGAGGKYYREYPTSMSLGVGLSMATGMDNLKFTYSENNNSNTSLSSSSKTEIYVVNQKPATMLDLTVGKAWGNRFRLNVEIGYSVKLAGGSFSYSKPDNATKTGTDLVENMFKLLSPGGLILGAGLAIGL